jgi:hypothetical protein
MPVERRNQNIFGQLAKSWTDYNYNTKIMLRLNGKRA